MKDYIVFLVRDKHDHPATKSTLVPGHAHGRSASSERETDRNTANLEIE